MSTPRRAYDLLRGYVNREFERLQTVDLRGAAKELESSLSNPVSSSRSTPDTGVPTVTSVPEPYDQPAMARRILGVAPDADFATIRQAFDRLNRRSAPENFPAGSPEAYQAQQIQSRVQEAYRILISKMDSTELRFGTLELE